MILRITDSLRIWSFISFNNIPRSLLEIVIIVPFFCHISNVHEERSKARTEPQHTHCYTHMGIVATGRQAKTLNK